VHSSTHYFIDHLSLAYNIAREPLPLLEHIATVSAYFKEYNIPKDEEIQQDNSFRFSCYLFTACWPKMLRRITSWQALGLISAMDTFEFDLTLMNHFPILSFKLGSGDNVLGSFLKNVEESSNAKEFLSFSDSEWSSLKEVVCSIQSQPEMPPLSRETCKAFGNLVATAFKCFAASLIKLSTEHKKLVCSNL